MQTHTTLDISSFAVSVERRPVLHVATGVKVSAPPTSAREHSERMLVVDEDGKVDDDDAIGEDNDRMVVDDEKGKVEDDDATSVLPSSHFGFSAKVCCERCCPCFRFCSF